MQLYVEETGPQDAHAIVFLHGGGLSGRMWQPQLEALSDYHCIVPDLPEQGQSANISPFSLDDSARRVANLIQIRCAQQRAHLVGLSLGGVVALTVLNLTPELVDRVVISGTAAGLGRLLGSISKVSARLYRYLDAETLVKLSIQQFGIPPQYQDIFRDDLLKGMTEAFTQHYTDALMAMRLPTGALAPTLVAVGERETWIAKQAARKIAAILPHALAVIAPGVGHVWNLQRPRLFSDMLRAWYEDKPLPTELRSRT